jgi:hypothetical protein
VRKPEPPETPDESGGLCPAVPAPPPLQAHLRRIKDDTLVVEIARGATREEAAKAARCSVRTVYSRLRDPEFQRRVAELRSETLTRAVAKLNNATGKAAERLSDLLDAKEVVGVDANGERVFAPDNKTQLGAARGVFGDLIRLMEFTKYGEQVRELEERLRRLEETKAKKKNVR